MNGRTAGGRGLGFFAAHRALALFAPLWLGVLPAGCGGRADADVRIPEGRSERRQPTLHEKLRQRNLPLPPTFRHLESNGLPIIASYGRWLKTIQKQTGPIQSAHVVGGTPTQAYPQVGAIRSNGETHCTGTLVRSDRVLTAAHCVKSPYSGGALSFVAHPQPWLKGASVRPVRVQGILPRADLAILSVGGSSSDTPMKLDGGAANLAPGDPSRIVGYGRVSGRSGNIGARSVGDIVVERLDSSVLTYGSGSVRSCHGDSGGPVLKQAQGTLMVVGVVTRGDSLCETRSEAHRLEASAAWLEAQGIPVERPKALEGRPSAPQPGGDAGPARARRSVSRRMSDKIDYVN